MLTILAVHQAGPLSMELSSSGRPIKHGAQFKITDGHSSPLNRIETENGGMTKK